MNTRVIARDLAKEPPHSLREGVARFAIAINVCSAQNMLKSGWEQVKRELTREPDTS
jgi:hypothetical protein